LTPFIGENPQGCWTLEIWDTRLDSPLPTNGVLLSWDLEMTISSTNVHLIVLSNGIAYSSGPVAGNSITYFAVDVPQAASYATNILSKGSSPLNLLFNQDALPTGQLPGDATLLSDVTSASDTLSVQGVPPPLIPGKRYYMGVENSGATPARFTLEVAFDLGPVVNNVGPAFVGASMSSPSGGFSMTWVAVPGQSYTVEASTDLINWAVMTNIVSQSYTIIYTDSVPASSQTARFFRLTTP
jgi:hypothetical protein